MSVIDFRGERINPALVSDTTFANHVSRYIFARKAINLIFGQREIDLLDAACGSGYGSYFLGQDENLKVLGVDVDEAAISFAREFYSRENVDFERKDLQEPLDCGIFDCIVSFETLEHIDFVEQYFVNLTAKLKPQGAFILSVPDKRSNIDRGYKNEFHVNEMYLEQLLYWVEKYFTSYEVYIQPQKKISKMRRIVGKLLSSFVPIIKSLIALCVRLVVAPTKPSTQDRGRRMTSNEEVFPRT